MLILFLPMFILELSSLVRLLTFLLPLSIPSYFINIYEVIIVWKTYIKHHKAYEDTLTYVMKNIWEISGVSFEI